ncbi:MAG TPA: hypothetical protein VEW26_11680 [Allosphingosinicella sp.]|nr:hypothetical protein [Allosphingosinicella sp.]
MIELYKAEGRRFGRWAFGLAVLHLAVLFFLDRASPGIRDSADAAKLAGFGYGLGGAIFGFYQSASYARLNHWIALLHRPLAPWRIMAAIAGAGATLLLAAVLIPLLGFTAEISLQAGRVVDARHWLLALAGGVMGLVGFGIGSYLALAPRRYGWTALVAAGLLIATSSGTGGAALLLPLLMIAALTLLLIGAFRPDRSLPPSNPALLALTAAVAAFSLYFLLLTGVAITCQLGLAAIGRNPMIDTPPPGGLVEAWRAGSNELLDAALAANAAPDVIRAELRGVDAFQLPVALDELPARGALTNVGSIAFIDPRRGIEWTYSHDGNAFMGLRLKDRRSAGELRPDGGFESPPLLLGDGSMIAGGSLYRLDPRSGTLERRLRLPPGEAIVARPVPVEPAVAVLSDRALYFVDPNGLESGRSSGGRIAVRLPGPIGDLGRLDLARLPDRAIVSFFFRGDIIEGPSRAWQSVVSVAPDGTVTRLAERPLGPDHPDALRFCAYWLSPAIRAIAGAAEGIGSGSARTLRRAPVEVPRGIWIAAGLLSLGAAAATALLAVRRRLGPREIAAWTLAALAFGIPMLGAFWVVRRVHA